MSPEEKKLEKLSKLFELVNEEYATPDDLVKFTEGILGIIEVEKKQLNTLIEKTGDKVDAQSQAALAKLTSQEEKLKSLITKVESVAKEALSQATESLLSDIKRVEKKIPTKTDLSDLYREIAEIKDSFNTLPTELTMNNEAVRDGLELLQGDERLNVSAIGGLDEKLSELSTTTKSHETNFGRVIRSVRAGTGVTVDASDPNNPVVSSTGGGGGHVIEDEGTPLTQRANMNFVGAGVTVTDAGGKTVVTIPSGGAGVSDGDKGDITVTASGATWTIDPAAVTLAKQADVATGTVFYRRTAATGSPEVQTLATLKTDLGLTGTNSGDQTSIVGITGTKAQFDNAVTDANLVAEVRAINTTAPLSGGGDLSADRTLTTSMATNKLIGRGTAGTGVMEEITLGTNLSLTGTTLNATGGGNTFNDIFIDQSGGTSDTYGVLAGAVNGSNAVFTVSQALYATGTLLVYLNGQLQTQGTAEDFVETLPASGTFTFAVAPPTGSLITVEYQKVVTNSSTIVTTSTVNELAQDAVGTILTDSAEIDFTYNDAAPSITASIVAGSIDETKLDASTNTSLGLANTSLQPATIGVTVQGYDADLQAIGALTPTNDDLIQRKAGAWTNRTPAQVKTDLVLVKADVGLGNVDNTSDANKPVSTATQTALNLKEDLTNKSTDTNLGTSNTLYPTQNAVKTYVDAVAQGLTIKESVRVATAAALPTNTYNNGASGVGATLTAIAVGVLTVDGVAVVLNDRVLVKDEVAGANNGIYFCSVAGTAGVAYVLTRSTSFDSGTEISGAFTFVEEGTTLADNGFVCTTNDPITVGTTAISFTQFSGAGQITAGAALTKTGNTLDVAVDGASMEINADALRRAALTGAVTAAAGSNTTALGSFTKALLDGAVSDGDVMYVGDAPTAHTHTLANISDVTMTVANLNSLDDGVDSTLHFHATDRARANHTGTQVSTTISDFTEAAQDAAGAMVATSIVYNDAGATLQRAALTGAITASQDSNATALGSFTKAQLDTAVSDANVVAEVRAINTTAPLSGGGDLSADRTLTTSMATNKIIGRGTAGTGVMEEITLGGGTELSATTIQANSLSNSQTGITYTYVSGDRAKTIVHSNALAIAGTMPQAGASFPDGWFTDVVNVGAGTLTITPVTSTINGGATLVLTTGQGARIMSNGANYFAILGKSSASGSGDVVGPASATDNALARFDLATGKLLQDGTLSASDVAAGVVTLSTIGNNDLTLQTGNATTGSITIADGANGAITINPDGSGHVIAAVTGGSGQFLVGDGSSIAVVSSNGPQSLLLETNTGTNSGVIAINQGANANITISPNGTGITQVDGSITPLTNDDGALGSTTNQFSDLFLASGGVINFNNGNATLTHSAGLITSNVDIAVPDEVYGVGWNGSLEAPTKNAVYDKIETLGGGVPYGLILAHAAGAINY